MAAAWENSYRGLARRLLLALLVWVTAAHVAFASYAGGWVSSPAHSSSFSIADFDGDGHPDLARIQISASNFGTATYSIQLRLTSSGQHLIQFTAPVGGLQIQARDVNGNHALDLVVTTAWLRDPVAIFLNDGHGGFSRAATGEYPEAFQQQKTNWTRLPSNAVADSVGVPPQSRTWAFYAHKAVKGSPSAGKALPISNSISLITHFSNSHAGRAPPLSLHS